MWEARLTRPGHVHVLPIDDVVEHKAEEDCICFPGVEYIHPREDDQTSGWLYTLFSLDGREWREKANKS